jgi:hypothetical protein
MVARVLPGLDDVVAAAKKPSRRANGGQGMRWCRSERRLGLYLRDGLACVWCGATIESGATLTLDHIVPYANGGGTWGNGGNENTNLVTACKRCNSSRGRRSIEAFARAIGGDRAEDILGHIETTRARPVDVKAAKALIARRGTFAAACRKDQS